MELLLIAILAFSIRIAPVIKTERVDFDTYGHLYYASAIREQKRNPWDSINIQCWAGEKFSHPFLLHWLIGRFKKQTFTKYQKIINPALDALFAVFIYYASQLHFGGDKKISVLCVLLYIFTPMWFSRISMGPRVHNFTPRLITEIAFPVLIFIALYREDPGNILHSVLIEVLIITLIINSTKFGVQVILFMVPLIAAITFKHELIISVALAVIVTSIISRGGFFAQMKRQARHLIEYYHSNRRNQTSTTDRNRFIKIRIKKLQSKEEIKKIIYCYLYNNSYTAVIIKMPLIGLALANLINGVSNIQGNPGPGNAILISALMIYLLVNKRRFLFLGEAERYLNHISIVIVFEAVTYAQSNNEFLFIYAILAYGVMFWIAENMNISKFTNSTSRNLADEEIETILTKMVGEKIVCTYCYHNFCVYRIMLNTRHKVIFSYHMKAEVSRDFIAKYQSNYPYINLDNINDMIAETKCNVLIIDNYSANEKNLSGLKLERDGWCRIELSNNVYTLYKKND